MKYLLAIVVLAVGGQLDATEPLLQPGDRLALLGGTFVERMQIDGALEAELHARRPNWKLGIRNLGWSGDDVHGLARKVFGDQDQGFQRMMQDIQAADPTAVLVAYGFSEASDGGPAVERFGDGLKQLVRALRDQQRRVILVTPIAMPGYRVDGYRESMQRTRQIVSDVGIAVKVPVIQLDWQPTADQLSPSQLLPSDSGYKTLANVLADDLVGPVAARSVSDDIHRLISEKNQLFFHRYRPQNETYLFLFRKHEQGNNAVEIEQFDPLIESSDQAIWATATAR